MEWLIWIASWIVFCIRYSRLFSAYHQKHQEKTRTTRIFVEKIENRAIFRIKTGYYLKLLMPEIIKLLGCTEGKITKNEEGENMPRLEITEKVLAHCNIFNNDYRHNSRVLYTFVPNESFGQLSDIWPKNVIFVKPFNSEFSYIGAWFTNQSSKPGEIRG